MAFDTSDKIIHFRDDFLRSGKHSKVKWYFYYDETNNFRRLKIDKALNKSSDGVHIASDSLEKSFVIGGIAVATKEAEQVIRQAFADQQFLTSLDSQSGRLETKCRQICIGHNAVQVLNNTRVGRVNDFLKLLDRDDVYVHVSTTNAFFYYIVSEIVQKLSLILGKEDKGIDYSSHSLEDMLYDIARDDKVLFMETLKYWGYPSMDYSSDIRGFCDALESRLESIKDSTFCDYSIKCNPERRYELGRLLRHVAIKCILIGNISDERLRIGPGDDYIVDSLCDFYWSPCLVWYPFSHHVFDEETEIKEKLNSLLPKGALTNFEMLNSANDIMIQASDVWVGLYAKYEELLDDYVTKMILPNYKVNPYHFSLEDLKACVKEEKERLDFLYIISGNRIAYNVAIKGLQNKFERKAYDLLREMSFPNTDEATQRAADAILKQLNETGKENIRLISKLIIKSVEADEYTYRIEDSGTIYRLRMNLIKALATS